MASGARQDQEPPTTAIPLHGRGSGTAAAAGREDARAAVEAAQAAFGVVAERPRTAPSPAERRDLLVERPPEIAATVTEETGGIFGWGMFNCVLAAGMLREAAAQPTARSAT